ncbi:hypothetical protein N7532_002543 [Penicillium argentinense]|uniref:Transcription factor domain-containing protein n=1 Tax=Penicillium argentinense TaxID=1131581 RepID=A0A9W9G0L3_9EURO|nr:uncharacterized protein N7532_002543 [Penicillium argentinense]KAJ5109898.1 hypothetical protein N7532_002543 [Penicillium argentinense]
MEANDTDLAMLHIGLVTNLAKCGGLDVEQDDISLFPASESRRRLFWSIHFLNQQYGLRSMQLNMLHDIHRPVYETLNMGSPRQMGTKPPGLPQETGIFTSRGDIWVYMVQLGCLWCEVQQYVSHCSSGDLTPPWSVESGYSILGAHLMDVETKFPTVHRWDSVRFWEQPKEDLHAERGYWSPWVYLQFTYHAIHSVLNHPFIYSWRPQQSAQLAVPNTFWKTSSELALIHSTWTVRLIEMITEKEYQLSDPFLAHAVSIAATIHIYYCRAADPAIRESAQRSVDVCIKFLGELALKWPRCQPMHQKLQTLVHSAFTGSPDVNNKRSSRRTLSIDTALMWDILLHNSSRSSFSSPGEGLFDISFLQAQTPNDKHQDKVTVETEIFHRSSRAVDTSDGGQALPPYSSKVGDRANSTSPVHGPWNADTIGSDTTQIPLPRESLYSGIGLQGDMSFMDITHDPFFQFQDHQQPYLGIWEIGNL